MHEIRSLSSKIYTFLLVMKSAGPIGVLFGFRPGRYQADT